MGKNGAYATRDYAKFMSTDVSLASSPMKGRLQKRQKSQTIFKLSAIKERYKRSYL